MTDFIHGVEHIENTDGVRTIRSQRLSIAGIVGTAPDIDADLALDTPIRVSSRAEAALFGTSGTLAEALSGFFEAGGRDAVVVAVAEGASLADSITAAAGDATAMTGVHALMASQSVLGITPRVLVAPGLTSANALAQVNAVTAALSGVASALRAVAVVAGPNTTDADAITAAALIGSDRVLFVDPYGLVSNPSLGSVPADPCARIAGVMVSNPYWHSPSNKLIPGLLGPARPIVHIPNDPDSQTNRLNAANVATIINDGGVRLWGNRGTGTDPQTAFISVRRIRDAIGDAIVLGHRWAIDRNISKTLGQDVVEGVNAFIRHLIQIGAIINGRAWLDPELNTPASIAAGRIYINYDFAASTPLERLTFTSFINNDYYKELADRIAEAA